MFDDYIVQMQSVILVKKNQKFPFCVFLDKRGLEIMFDNHLVREQAFPHYKK